MRKKIRAKRFTLDGLKNHNPLNISYDVGKYMKGCIGNNRGKAVFREMGDGIVAAFNLLHEYNIHHLMKIKYIVQQWCNERGHNYNEVIRTVCGYVGNDEDCYIFVSSLDDREKACKLLAALSFIENRKDYLSVNQLNESWYSTFKDK